MEIKVKSRVTTTIDSDLLKHVRENHWSLQELLEFGIKFKLAEIDTLQFQHPQNSLINKIKNLIEEIQRLNTEQEKKENGTNKN